MQATFLSHSGFLIELEQALLLFDWWKGELPPLPDKPLFVFVSHGHEDHFSPGIFSLFPRRQPVCFLLSETVPFTENHQKQWNLSVEAAKSCVFVREHQCISPADGITVETLPSTDEGVAFLVTVDGVSIYHAGDLNWWHWEGEAPAWNLEMEQNFKQYTAPLNGRRIDLAMLPIDPRQEHDGFRGAAHLLQHADIRRCLPMHQWEDFDFTNRFLASYPQFARLITPVTHTGQQIVF